MDKSVHSLKLLQVIIYINIIFTFIHLILLTNIIPYHK